MALKGSSPSWEPGSPAAGVGSGSPSAGYLLEPPGCWLQPCPVVPLPFFTQPVLLLLGFFFSSFTFLLPARAHLQCSFAHIDPMVLQQMSRSIPSHFSAPNSAAQALLVDKCSTSWRG